jgi:hypothetical protein
MDSQCNVSGDHAKEYLRRGNGGTVGRAVRVFREWYEGHYQTMHGNIIKGRRIAPAFFCAFFELSLGFL